MQHPYRRLYSDLYRIRRTEEVIAELYREQEMRCPVHLCTGQEAIPVGVSSELAKSDVVFSAHRSHGHYLAKGGSLRGLVAELYGRESGCSMGKGGSMHLVDVECGFLGAVPILGASIPLAVGAAFGTRMRGEERIAVSYFGDGALEEGIFYEAANFAALQKLPVLFVCENNQLSMYSGMEIRQPAGRSAAAMAQGIGLKAASGNGNDVLDVARHTREAVAHMRGGNGPVFLELHTFRWCEHCGPGNDAALGYCSAEQARRHQENCPIDRLRRHMIENGIWDERTFSHDKSEIEQEIEDAVEFARSSPFPDGSLLLQHEYADGPSYRCEVPHERITASV